MDIVERCNNYISGGLFNPELAIHENVRDMIIDCRDQMVAQKAEVERLREALQDICEVYAGSEGIPKPMTAAEGYLLERLMEAVRIAARALAGKIEEAK